MTERSGVFVLQDDDSLISMRPAEFATEADFQLLLARFPALLVGDQIDPQNPRKWILVKREQTIATDESGGTQWSIDHLFLDQDGIPTLVEVKRQTDTRIRREVVGQMLDYAANCTAYWSIDMLRTNFERTCEAAGQISEAVLAGVLGPDDSPDEYWDRVKQNLIDGRIRLLFIADVVPVELRRIVEFLNRQMDPAEVLAIELRQFAGKGLKTLVPMVIGQIQEVLDKRHGRGSRQRWDEPRFFEKLGREVGAAEIYVARQLLEWMRRDGRAVSFGTGREHGSVFPVLRPNGITINPVYLTTDGKLCLQFGAMEGKPVLGHLETRRELMRKLATVRDVSLEDADLTRYPSIPLSKIASDPQGLEKVLMALRWLDEQLAQSESRSTRTP